MFKANKNNSKLNEKRLKEMQIAFPQSDLHLNSKGVLVYGEVEKFLEGDVYGNSTKITRDHPLAVLKIQRQMSWFNAALYSFY